MGSPRAQPWTWPAGRGGSCGSARGAETGLGAGPWAAHPGRSARETWPDHLASGAPQGITGARKWPRGTTGRVVRGLRPHPLLPADICVRPAPRNLAVSPLGDRVPTCIPPAPTRGRVSMEREGTKDATTSGTSHLYWRAAGRGARGRVCGRRARSFPRTLWSPDRRAAALPAPSSPPLLFPRLPAWPRCLGLADGRYCGSHVLWTPPSLLEDPACGFSSSLGLTGVAHLISKNPSSHRLKLGDKVLPYRNLHFLL